MWKYAPLIPKLRKLRQKEQEYKGTYRVLGQPGLHNTVSRQKAGRIIRKHPGDHEHLSNDRTVLCTLSLKDVTWGWGDRSEVKHLSRCLRL